MSARVCHAGDEPVDVPGLAHGKSEQLGAGTRATTEALVATCGVLL
jgi:hypothetical protein